MSIKTYFYEDFSAKDLDESVVGRKGMSLFQLKDADVPVPPFFVVPPELFEELIYKAFGNDVEKYLRRKTAPDPIDVEKLLLETQLPSELEEDLFKAYAKLSGFNDAWVAVRSSVIYLPDKKVLFSGVFDTEVNIRGFEDLIKAMKKVYASIFKDYVVGYAQKHNIDLSQLKMAVVVQKMVQAEVSGVTYTKELITQDESKMSIEAVFGLGDVIANGEITPDRYVLNKDDLTFLEKKVSPQEWMNIRMLSTKGQGGVERVNISSSWSHQQKLEDRFLKEIAKICLLIEDSFGASQNIEWVWEGGRPWIIQNKLFYTPQSQKRDQEQYSNALLNPILNVVKEKKEEEIRREADKEVCEDKACEEKKTKKKEKDLSELDKKIAKLSSKFEEFAKKKTQKEEKKIEKITKDINKEKEEITKNISKSLLKDDLQAKGFAFLATGIGVSQGKKVGRVMFVNSKNFKNLTISKENILVLTEMFPGVENVALRSGGVLMNVGGISSDLSVLCREFSIPAIFGVKDIESYAKEGNFVKMDANAGAVYVYKEEMEEEKEEKAKGNEKGNIDYTVVEKVKAKKEEQEKEEQEKPKPQEDIVETPEIPKTATEVYISSKDFAKLDKYIYENANGIAFLDLEKLILHEKRHPLAFVESGQMADYTNLIAKKIDSVADMFKGNEVIVSIGGYRSKDFAQLTKGKNFEKNDNTRGAVRYLQNPDFAKVVLKIVSKTRNLYRNKNVSLAVHSPFSAENMIAMKKKILSFGLRRNSTFKLYSIIDNPSEAILVEDILDSNIDGLVINTPALARQMQGLSLYDQKAVYSLETNSLFKTLESITEKLKNKDSKIIGITENNQKLIEKYIELGVCAVVVDGSEFEKTKKTISEKETQIILSRSRF